MITSEQLGNWTGCVPGSGPRNVPADRRPGRRTMWTDLRPVLFALAMLIVGSVLTACAGEPAIAASSNSSPVPQADVTAPAPSPGQDLARMDSQGAVEFAVSPQSWTREANGTIEFEISMNTHSVDLSMDLAKLSTLQTDLGASVAALDWTGGSGHHVVGVLRFPAATSTGLPILDGSALLILTVRDVDAPARIFQWEIASLP